MTNLQFTASELLQNIYLQKETIFCPTSRHKHIYKVF